MNDTILDIEEIKTKCFSVFDNETFVKKAYLFGSYAKKCASNNSDVDLFVEIDGKIGLHFFSLYDSLSQKLDKSVDVLTEDEIMQLDEKIKKEAILIYER